MDNTVLQLEKVNKIYGTVVKTQALFDLDLEFERGSFNAIIGQSGSGKSTLLNIIGALDNPTSGKVVIDGIDITKKNQKELSTIRNKTIGFIFQFHYLLPEFTAYENVLMPYWMNNMNPPNEIIDKANYLMEKMGLKDVKDKPSTNISGGQQQRTAIARSLINNPPIVLADEPTGNLDSENTQTVYYLLREINKEFKTTFILVTHDQRVAQMADRIIELKDGKIKMDVNNFIEV
ncbi:MAG: lipoprotein-releasing system ATP-binding protein [Thermotogaceae bacterium]|jgi:lipoprotein-releasing system ATP-binding protein|nr:lipoprotein-releasing system ATP-binding protein [Thermotogaceae bacterium]